MKKTDFLQFSEQHSTSIYQYIFEFFEKFRFSTQLSHIFTSASLLIVTFILLLAIDYLLRKVLYSTLTKIAKKTTTQWDDFVLHNKVHVHVSRTILVLLSQQVFPLIFVGFPQLTSAINKILSLIVILTIYNLVNSVLKSFRDILRGSKAFKDKPIDSYLQVVQIFLIFVVATLAISLLTGNSPWSFLVSLGAASAILMLVFKDTCRRLDRDAKIRC